MATTMLDPADVSELFEAHAAPLVLYARQWLGCTAAEDVVQEAFVRLMRQPRSPNHPQAWLYQAVRNEAISAWRSGRRREKRERDVGVREPWFEPAVADDMIDAASAAETIAQLPPLQREIVVLRIWSGLKLAEISNLVGVPVSSVFHHFQQALAEVRRRMGVPCNGTKANN